MARASKQRESKRQKHSPAHFHSGLLSLQDIIIFNATQKSQHFRNTIYVSQYVYVAVKILVSRMGVGTQVFCYLEDQYF